MHSYLVLSTIAAFARFMSSLPIKHA